MRPLYAAALTPLVMACASDVTHISNTVPADAMRACAAATAEDRGVRQALVTVTDFRPEATGPALTMDANGETVLCKLDVEGEVTSLTMGSEVTTP